MARLTNSQLNNGIKRDLTDNQFNQLNPVVSLHKSRWCIYGITILGILILTLFILVSGPDKTKVPARQTSPANISSPSAPADKIVVSVAYEWGK